MRKSHRDDALRKKLDRYFPLEALELNQVLRGTYFKIVGYFLHDKVLVDDVVEELKVVDSELIDISSFRPEKQFRSIWHHATSRYLFQSSLQGKLFHRSQHALTLLQIDLRNETAKFNEADDYLGPISEGKIIDKMTVKP